MKKFLACIAVLSASCLIFGACGSSEKVTDSFTSSDSGSNGSYAPDYAGGGSGESGGWYDKSEGSDGGATGGYESTVPPTDGGTGGSGSPSEGDSPSSGDSSGAGGIQKPVVKQLTGAEWRDAFNYDRWLKLFEKDIPIEGQNGQYTKDGIFSQYAKATRGLETFEMHEVYVSCDDNPVVGANVTLYSENSVAYSAVTDSTGTAYVFGNGTQVEAVSGEFSASAAVSDDVTQITLSGCAAYEDELEIMFVVDTTGSMGDELSFLCNELAGIVTRVTSSLDCKIRLGLLFYRDKGDQYVTKKSDFVYVNSPEGLSTVVNDIKSQHASGGGDYPEAVDTALKEAVEADWHSDSKTKLIFHVLDAPYHDAQQNQSVFADAVKNAAQQGIRVIPVAASGLNVLGQYIMRSAALLTGGTYTFLTDDSGIGNRHELPAVGAFTVEYLSDLMVRLIKGYYTGTFEDPVYWLQSDKIA